MTATTARALDLPASHPTLRLQLAVSAASIFGPLNSTMIAVALVDIRDDFGVSVGAITLLVSAYLIATAVLQPACGRLGDAFGHLRTVQVGLAVLVLTSIGAALAWNFPLLVTLRSLQGVAAALTMPNVVAYLRKRVEPAKLGGALGLNSSAISVGAAGGPLLGVALVALGGWQLIFLVNVPLALLTMALLSRMEQDEGAGRGAFHIDGVSLASLAAVFGGLTWLGSALRGSNVALVAAAAALTVLGVAAYGWRYRSRGTGVLELRLFTHRAFLVASLLVLLSNLLMYTTLVAMPVFLEDVEGSSGLVVGVALFAMSAGMVIVSPFSGRIADSAGERLPIVASGLALLACVAGLLLALGRAPEAALVGLLLLMGVGMSLAQAPLQSKALKAWPISMAGSAAGSFSLMRYTGSIAGAAMLAALLGEHAGTGEFRVVFAVLAGLGIAYLVVALGLGRDAPPDAKP